MDSNNKYDWSNKRILVYDDELQNYIIIEKNIKNTNIKIFNE